MVSKLNQENKMESDQYKEVLTRYPFLSSSNKLIDYFAIIGYHDGIIEQLIKDKNTTINKYSPIIISSVISKNNENENWSNSIIVNQIYPNNPPMEYNEKEISSKVFCITFDSANGKNKMIIVCYAYLFYEQIKGFYFPKAYCIISQYPFFTTFKSLCQSIHSYYLSYQSFPIEYIVTSIVNYYPSPINFSLEYSFCEKAPSVRIPKLSGYPYVDFNLVALFFHLPLPLVIEIYLLTIIECNMVFFSSENEEILNIIMYIFSILNFPCNDSNYFWHLVSISKDSFLNVNRSSNGQFTSKLYSTISGVYASYEEIAKEIKNTKETPFVIVDLDNKKIAYHYHKKKNHDPEHQIMKQILYFVNKIARERSVNSIYLKKPVAHLMNDLSLILDKTNIKEETNFLKIDDKSAMRNRSIQLAFYEFYLSFLTVFYKENQLKLDSETTQKHGIIKKRNTFNAFQMSVELNLKEKADELKNPEDLFSDEFKSTFKYSFFFINFIQVFKCLDTYRISLVFSEEFLTHQEKDREKEKEKKEKNDKEPLLTSCSSSYFDIMDHFYKVNRTDFKKIDWKTLQNHLVTDTRFYNINQLDRNIDLKRQLPIHLNTKTVLNFISFCNNLSEDTFDSVFPFYSTITNEPIAVVPSDSIVSLTEEKFYQMKKISSFEILLSSFVYLLGMIILSNKDRLDILNCSKEILKKIPYFKRKYISILLKYMDLIRRNINMNRENEEILNEINNLAFYYFPLFNSFRNAKMIPNEELMNLLNIFVPLVEGIGDLVPQELIRNSMNNNNNNSRNTVNNTEILIEENGSYINSLDKQIEINQKERISADLFLPETTSLEKFVSSNDNKYEINAETNSYMNIIDINAPRVNMTEKLNEINYSYDIKDKNKKKLKKEWIVSLFTIAENERSDCCIPIVKEDQQPIITLELKWKKHISKVYSPMKMLNNCRKVSSQILNNKSLSETEKDIFNDLLLNFLFYTKHLGFTTSQMQGFEKDIIYTFIINNYPND